MKKSNNISPKMDELKQSYNTLFGGDIGRDIIKDLKKQFHIESSTYTPGNTVQDIAFREGTRAAILYILRMCKKKQ